MGDDELELGGLLHRELRAPEDLVDERIPREKAVEATRNGKLPSGRSDRLLGVLGAEGRVRSVANR